MKYFIYFVAYIYLKLNVGATEPGNTTMEDYLQEKTLSLTVKQENRSRSFLPEYGLKLHDHFSQGGSWKFAHTFSLFNESYVMLNKDFHKAFYRKFISPRTILEAIDNKGPVGKARVIEFDNKGILFATLNDKTVKIVRFERNITNYRDVQTIEHQHISDVHFFMNKGKLFLIISNEIRNNPGLIKIYEWNDNLFDEQTSIFMEGVLKLEVLEQEGISIILIFQNKDGTYFCNVFEYEDRTLSKRQVFEVVEPRFVLPFTFKNERFILIISYQDAVIYRWTGFNMVEKSRSPFTNFHPKITLMYTKDNLPLIVAITHNRTLVYKLTPEYYIELTEDSPHHNFTEILDVEVIHWNGTKLLMFIANYQQSGHILSYTLEDRHKEEEIFTYVDPIRSCLLALNAQIDNFSSQNSTELRSRSLRSTSSNSTKSRNAEINKIELENELEEIQEKYSSIAPVIENFKEQNEEVIINGRLIINGTLKGDEMSAQNLNFKLINGKKWVPNQWLSYTKNQTIAGGKDAKNLNAQQLITTPEVTIFEDLLLNNSNPTIHGSMTFKNLNTMKMFVNEINNIKMKEIFMRERDSIIENTKTFAHITAGSVETKNILNENSRDILNRMIANNQQNSRKFGSNVVVEDLEVDNIDGVNWNSFKNSVFRYGITTTITGNIRMKEFDTKNLNLITLNGLNVDEFMTTSTDQNITSPIEFINIFASNITTNTVNGISLTEVATINNPFVKGPVSIEDMHIQGDIIYNSANSSILRRNQHIVGTNESDFIQFYTDRIKIIGNLRVKNLKTEESAIVVVEDGDVQKDFNANLRDIYWMKNENQVIPVHVEVQEGMTTPHLQTKLLNGVGLLNYMLNNTNKTFPTNFAFENVTFLENIFLNENKLHTPDLQNISSESVKTNGTFVIKGKKIFKDSLKVKNLLTDELNGMKQNQLYSSNGVAEFLGEKTFETLIIRGNFTAKNHSCKELNGIDLSKLIENAVYINSTENLNNLNLKNISMQNPRIDVLNDRPIDEYMVETNDMFDSGVIDNLIINGKLTIGNLMNLSKINEKDPKVLHTNKIKLDEGVLHGNVRFMQNVTIDNLSASIINNIDFPLLVRRLLYKNGNQTIPAVFNFNNLISKNLIVPQINDFNVENLVNVESSEPQKIFAENGIEFPSAALSILKGDNISPCNIDMAMNALNNPPSQTWSNMKIIGNVTILDQENPLYEIFKNVVLTNEKNTIEAPVHFANNISVQNVITMKHINDIDLRRIFSDALLKETEENQIITGSNIFKKIAMYRAVVRNNSDIPVVNGIDINKLSKQIISKYEVHSIPIRGKKTFFAGLQTNALQSKTVSNIVPENLVTVNNLRQIPSATFENIEILEDLFINRINDQDFNFFLQERLLVSGPPVQKIASVCSFNDIHIKGNLTTPSINDIEIDDVVFDMGTQKIESRKEFMEDVHINGNIDVEMLNGYMISRIFEKAVLRNQESFINKNVEITKPTIVNGIINTEYINGYSLEKLRKILNSETGNHLKQEATEIVYAIEKSANNSYKTIEKLPSEVMYLEKSTALQISFPKTIDAHTFNLKEFVLIQIEGEENGDLCGMPTQCKCPVHYTVQISPENSISHFMSKDFERLFNYADEYMAAHLITNSITTDMICRTNTSQSERTILAWNTANSENVTGNGFSHHIDFIGYISAVEFFSLNGTTYVIIGKYYNSTGNSYDLDCVVYKFSQDRTSVSEIQRIPTVGVWSLKIFYTAQGVQLIIGMVGDGHPSNEFEKTQFMRFDEIQEEFFLLREVGAYGCSSSVGIVLETDSFIALSHRRYPLLIFKYDKEQDNYIYYQHLWETPVVRGLSLFYNNDYDVNDPYLCIVSEYGVYSIYTYEFIGGWQRKFRGSIHGLRNLVPFKLQEDLYLFAPSTNASSVLSVVKFGAK